MIIVIKNRWTGAAIYNGEGKDLRAVLEKAVKEGANLRGAYLVGAYLEGAYLRDANLRGAYLRGANLETVQADMADVLAAAPFEAPGLLQALRDGRVDGSAYEGECACLVGTIAKIRGVHYREMDGIAPNSARPAESWFLGIRKGDTPKTNRMAEIAAGWIEEFILSNEAALAGRDGERGE